MSRNNKGADYIHDDIRGENDAYINLANAIIVQAVKDYPTKKYRQDTTSFFGSEWYGELTTIPPDAIIKIAEKKAEIDGVEIEV